MTEHLEEAGKVGERRVSRPTGWYVVGSWDRDEWDVCRDYGRWDCTFARKMKEGPARVLATILNELEGLGSAGR